NVEKSWAFDGLKFVLHWGLIVPGYTNDFKLNENIKSISFYYMTYKMIERSMPFKQQLLSENSQYLKKYIVEKPLTKEEAADILLTYAGYRNEANGNSGDLFKLAYEKGLVSKEAYMDVLRNGVVKWQDAYDMTLTLYKYLNK
ncbi:thiamine biosynthesis protein, partial [Thermoanaerobacterium saccharolyticum]